MQVKQLREGRNIPSLSYIFLQKLRGYGKKGTDKKMNKEIKFADTNKNGG